MYFFFFAFIVLVYGCELTVFQASSKNLHLFTHANSAWSPCFDMDFMNLRHYFDFLQLSLKWPTYAMVMLLLLLLLFCFRIIHIYFKRNIKATTTKHKPISYKQANFVYLMIDDEPKIMRFVPNSCSFFMVSLFRTLFISQNVNVPLVFFFTTNNRWCQSPPVMSEKTKFTRANIFRSEFVMIIFLSSQNFDLFGFYNLQWQNSNRT